MIDLVVKNFKVKKRGNGVERTRWWNLTRDSLTKLSEKTKSESNWKLVGDADVM